MTRLAEGLVRQAIVVAKSGTSKDLPIGALVVDEMGQVISAARNAVIETGDPTAHAELIALREASTLLPRHSTKSATIVVTLEPCPMCAWSIRLFGIGKLVFGAFNLQYGAAGSVFDLLRDTRYVKPVEVVGGVLQDQCKKLLEDSFREIRDNNAR